VHGRLDHTYKLLYAQPMSSQLRSHSSYPRSAHIATVCACVYSRGGLLPETQPASSLEPTKRRHPRFVESSGSQHCAAIATPSIWVCAGSVTHVLAAQSGHAEPPASA
jgi:hypothetical protein